MDLATILISLALILLVGAYLARPFVERSAIRVTAADHERSALLAGRERVLAGLEELDMDRTMGKLDEDDYQQQRLELLTEGAQILRRLDDLAPAASSRAPDLSSADVELEARIERQVELLRASNTGQGQTAFCPACGHKTQAGDSFCTLCGQPLHQADQS
jgi:hypothetical protein